MTKDVTLLPIEEILITQGHENACYRQDRLCINRSFKLHFTPQPQFVAHTYICNVHCVSLAEARAVAAELGYDGIYL